MGIFLSVCKRRHHPISDVEGDVINVEEEYEQFSENDELLVNDRPDGESIPRPPTPCAKKLYRVK